MAKELPYFRFTVQDWQNGKISLESYELQGLFISVCGYYWINDCSITLAMLEKKFRDAKDLLIQLIEIGVLKHEKRHDKIEIEFLNLQYDLLSEKRKRRQIAGSMGGNAKAKLKQKASYKDKDKDKDNNKDKDNLLFPWYSENFKKWWGMWITYKKEQHRETYKSNLTQQAALKKLSELAGGDEEKAVLIIEQSIANSWKGLFELKNNKNAGTNTTGRKEQFADYFKNKGRESGDAA